MSSRQEWRGELADVVSDPELITGVRAGDRAAFGELYRRHIGAANTLARQFARSPAEADDLVSEAFARVLDQLLTGRGPDTAFRAYLFTALRNTAYDRTRKDRRLQFTDDMSGLDRAVAGDDPVMAQVENGMVAAAFARLPERWQAVLWHTQVEGESPAAVGALLGMAPGAVSSLAFRAREGLREAYLQAHLADTAGESCRTTVERLGAWTRGGLSKREKAQVDGHLAGCERCRALAAELQEVNTGLRALLAPVLLGAAAAGYLATLGPVAPLAAGLLGAAPAGAALAGSGSGAAGSAGSAGAGVAGAGTAGAAGSAGSAGAGVAGAGTVGSLGAAGSVSATAGTVGAATAGASTAAATGAGSAVGLTAGAAHLAGATGVLATGTVAGVGAGAGVVTAGVGAAGLGAVGAGAVGAGAVGVGAAGLGAAAAGAVGVGAAGVGAVVGGVAVAGASAAATGLLAVGTAAAAAAVTGSVIALSNVAPAAQVDVAGSATSSLVTVSTVPSTWLNDDGSIDIPSTAAVGDAVVPTFGGDAGAAATTAAPGASAPPDAVPLPDTAPTADPVRLAPVDELTPALPDVTDLLTGSAGDIGSGTGQIGSVGSIGPSLDDLLLPLPLVPSDAVAPPAPSSTAAVESPPVMTTESLPPEPPPADTPPLPDPGPTARQTGAPESTDLPVQPDSVPPARAPEPAVTTTPAPQPHPAPPPAQDPGTATTRSTESSSPPVPSTDTPAEPGAIVATPPSPTPTPTPPPTQPVESSPEPTQPSSTPDTPATAPAPAPAPAPASTRTDVPAPVVAPIVLVPTAPQPVTAGADARVSVELTGSGAANDATTASTVTVTAPDGVLLRALTVRLRPAPAGAIDDVAPAVPAADAAGPDPVGCDGATRCLVTLPAIPPHGALVLDVAVTVAANTSSDAALAVTIDDRSVAIPLTVTSGLGGVRLTGPAVIAAGTTAAFDVSAGLAPGVTDAGGLTIVSDSGDVTFPVAPQGCVADGDRRLLCGTQVTGLPVTIGTGQPPGPLPIRFLDAAGRGVPVTCDVDPVVVPTPPEGSPAPDPH